MKLNNEQKKRIQQKLLRLGLKIVQEAKMNITENGNVDTGRLRASLSAEVTDDFNVKVGTNVFYAPYIEYGTEPHEITPNEKAALRWEDEEGEHFAKRVQHPGTEPHPFLRPALDKVLNNTKTI